MREWIADDKVGGDFLQTIRMALSTRDAIYPSHQAEMPKPLPVRLLKTSR